MKNKTALIVGGVIIFIILLAVIGGSSSNNSGNQPQNNSASPDGSTSSDLDAKVSYDNSGVYITNQENNDWNNCEFGINGSWVALISSPPFSTHVTFAIRAGKQKFIPFNSITDNNGAFFDPNTHTINSVEIICPADSPDARYYDGSRVSSP